MKTQTKAIVASLVVIALALSAATSVTYSWWSDSENTDIDITTGYLDVTTSDYALYDWTGQDVYDPDSLIPLIRGSGSLPESISIPRIAPTSPENVAKFMVEYTAVFTSSIDAKYYVETSSNVDWIVISDDTSEGIQVMESTVENAKDMNGDDMPDDMTVGLWKGFTPSNTDAYAIITAHIHVPIYVDLDQANMAKEATVSIKNMIVQYMDDSVIWDGTVGDMPEPNDQGVYEITSAAQLAAFAKSVNEGNDYKDKTIVLMNDIDLNGFPWTPIGMADLGDLEDYTDDSYYPFKGTFNGNGFTVSNLYINTSDAGCIGLFGDMRGTVNNLVITGADVEGTTCYSNDGIGIVAGYSTGTITNVTVTDSKVSGDLNVGGIVGYNEGTVSYCTVSNTAVTANIHGSAGGIVGESNNDWATSPDDHGTVIYNTVEDVDITGVGDIGCIAGSAYGPKVSGNTVAGDNTLTVDWALITNGPNSNVGDVVGAVSDAIGANTVEDDSTLVIKTENMDADAVKNCFIASALNVPNATVYLIAGNYQPVSFAQGITIIGEDGVIFDNQMPTTIDGVTFQNIVFNGGAYETQVDATAMGEVKFIDCEFQTALCGGKTQNYSGGGGTVSYTNCTIEGWASYGSAIDSVSFEGCVFVAKNFTTTDPDQQLGYLRAYCNASLSNCVFMDTDDGGIYQGIEAVGSGVTVTLTDCNYVDGDLNDLKIAASTGTITIVTTP